MERVIYTIGHSNRDLNTFIFILKKFNINVLIDVRRFPSSKLAWFKRDYLKSELKSFEINYISIPELGALGVSKYVTPLQNINCISSSTFKSYITYLLSNSIAKSKIHEIVDMLNRGLKLCLMCRERFPWKCHRYYLSDYLKAMKIDVLHLIDQDRIYVHKGSRCYGYISSKIMQRNC
ncbi:MAG: DUF488 family protein [Nitrososphaerota archaeon]